MLGIASLGLILWDLFESEGVLCLTSSLRLLLALWVSMVAAILGLLCEVIVGVMLMRLMLSNLDVAAKLGTAMSSSFDMERRRELPPHSGDTFARCISMS